jgi:hypothetical protein
MYVAYGRFSSEVNAGRSFNFFQLTQSFKPHKALGFTQPLREMSTIKYFWGVERGRCIRLTISLPSVSMVIQCGLFNTLHPYRPPQSVMGIAFFFYSIRNTIGLHAHIIYRSQADTSFLGLRSLQPNYIREITGYLIVRSVNNKYEMGWKEAIMA